MRILIFLFAFLGFIAPALAGEAVTYKDGDTVLEGYLATPADRTNAPVVMIIHQWKGIGVHEKAAADLLAKQGYNAFAIDMYGQGVRPQTPDAAGAEASKYKSDPALAHKRMMAALDYARTLPNTSDKIAVIGYCFGGTMALDLARSGATLAGVVSFHGGLATASPAGKGVIHETLQIHHGAADPHVKPEEVAAFMQEMMKANADVSFYAYPDAVHAFTEQAAGDDPAAGAAYNKAADEKSWARALAYLRKVLK